MQGVHEVGVCHGDVKANDLHQRRRVIPKQRNKLGMGQMSQTPPSLVAEVRVQHVNAIAMFYLPCQPHSTAGIYGGLPISREPHSFF